jgi:uncharacterized protein involved in outer membrane biogenesis
MKKIFIVLLIIACILASLLIAKDSIIKSTITLATGQVTGAQPSIGKFHLRLLSQSVTIENFKMFNPKGFSKNTLIDLPKIRVFYNLAALLKKKLYLPSVEIELKELLLEKNREGQLNVDALKMAQKKDNKEKDEKKQTPQIPIQIDNLKLNLGRIVSFDYSTKKEQPIVLVYDIGLHKEYKNITSAQQLAALIISEPMKAAGIKGAQIYGVAMLAGTAILPAALAATFISKDHATADFSSSPNHTYEASLEALRFLGKVIKEYKDKKTIEGDVDGTQINIKIKENKDKKTNISVTARKHLLPKPEVAGGVLYIIDQKI